MGDSVIMAKHSPAPWKVNTRIIIDVEDESPLVSISIVDSGGHLVDGIVVNNPGSIHAKRVKADFELMALAPELAWSLIEIMLGAESSFEDEYVMDRAQILFDKVYALVKI